MTTRGQQPDVEVATAPTSRITHPERIPPIVAKRVPELLAEALELAKRAQGLVHDVNQVESTLALLSHDPGLGIETTTYDPVAERLEVLMDETGASAVSAVVYNTSLMLNDEGELLYELCERLGIERPDFGPPPRGPSGDTGGIAYSLTASVRPPAMPAPAPPPPRARAAR